MLTWRPCKVNTQWVTPHTPIPQTRDKARCTVDDTVPMLNVWMCRYIHTFPFSVKVLISLRMRLGWIHDAFPVKFEEIRLQTIITSKRQARMLVALDNPVTETRHVHVVSHPCTNAVTYPPMTEQIILFDLTKSKQPQHLTNAKTK